jgi:[ribosomal protein S5]-alanine N-acetyltransferase
MGHSGKWIWGKNSGVKTMIETQNLNIMPSELRHLDAILYNKEELELLLQVTVPASFPVVKDAVTWFYDRLQSNASLAGWLHFIVIDCQDRVAIGDAGFKGKPDESGTVEIGYSIIPEYRGRGFATEVTVALIKYAFSHSNVAAVQAHTHPSNIGSIGVLKKVGMRLVANIADGEEGEMLRWRLSKEDFVVI